MLSYLATAGYTYDSKYIIDAAIRSHAGGSGCGCSASVLAGYILPKIACGDWKRVLFVPTGALMSKVSFYEGNSVPGIAQGVVLEWEEGEVEQTC